MRQGLSHPGLRELPLGWEPTPEPICGFALAGPALACLVQHSQARPTHQGPAQRNQALTAEPGARSNGRDVSKGGVPCVHSPGCVGSRVPAPQCDLLPSSALPRVWPSRHTSVLTPVCVVGSRVWVCVPWKIKT